MCDTLRILNVSGCGITDFGIEKAALESLISINISNCKFLTEQSIHRIIENWEISSLCVKSLNLSVVQLEELYGHDMQAGIIPLCGLRTEQGCKCMYCRETIFQTWTDVTGIDSLSTLIIWLHVRVHVFTLRGRVCTCDSLLFRDSPSFCAF